MNSKTKKGGLNLTLWIPVFLAFVLLIAAWTTIIVIAKGGTSLQTELRPTSGSTVVTE